LTPPRPEARVIGTDAPIGERGTDAVRPSASQPGSSGWARVVAFGLAARPGRLLVVADFDGTLAEASRDPGAARIVPLAQRALRRLVGVADAHPERVSVAVLTGRTAADVAARVGVGGIVYLGDHGLQRGMYPRGARPTSIVTTFAAGHEDSHEPAARLADRVPVLLGDPAWLFVERKGPSVAFHVRQADDPLAARASVEAAIEDAERDLPPHDLAHYRGRLVVDLRPRTAGGKREAMEALLAQLDPATVVAFGDDSSDADAFGVLRAARSRGTCDGLAIGVTGPRGVPDDVRASADVVLDAPLDAARLLSALARAVAERNA
jgi:trehalose 6-phosphate phosphatase